MRSGDTSTIRGLSLRFVSARADVRLVVPAVRRRLPACPDGRRVGFRTHSSAPCCHCPTTTRDRARPVRLPHPLGTGREWHQQATPHAAAVATHGPTPPTRATRPTR